jgi:hypothetical protein
VFFCDSDVLGKVDCLDPDSPPSLWACLDNFILKTVATMHSHTLLRQILEAFEDIS